MNVPWMWICIWDLRYRRSHLLSYPALRWWLSQAVGYRCLDAAPVGSILPRSSLNRVPLASQSWYPFFKTSIAKNKIKVQEVKSGLETRKEVWSPWHLKQDLWWYIGRGTLPDATLQPRFQHLIIDLLKSMTNRNISSTVYLKKNRNGTYGCKANCVSKSSSSPTTHLVDNLAASTKIDASNSTLTKACIKSYRTVHSSPCLDPKSRFADRTWMHFVWKSDRWT